jgi:amidase
MHKMDVFSTTAQLAAEIRRGGISAREALGLFLAQIEKHNPALNAVNIIDPDAAAKRAQAADEALSRGELWGPLHGVPFTLKDAHSTAGLRTTVGFPPFANYVPEIDSTVVARLKQAGAVIMGRTNVPVMLGDHQTDNPLFGRTNNPWDVERTPGGSSGGAAAALAAGMTPFEVGTDLANSIRLPAHFCGVYGLKPTEKRVSLNGLLPNPNKLPRPIRIMSCIGPLARTVEDLALLYRIIAGPDYSDTELQPVPVEEIPKLSLADLRIAFAPALPGFPVAEDIRLKVEELARALERAGARVEEAPLPELDLPDEFSKAGRLIGMMLGTAQPVTDRKPIKLAEYFEALDERDRSIQAWERFFQSRDVLLCPVSMITAFKHCVPGKPLQVDGRDTEYWLVSAYGTIFNYTGHPAVALPSGFDRDGLPIGVQLVGKRWSESRLLAIAQTVSAVAGEFRRPPGF